MSLRLYALWLILGQTCERRCLHRRYTMRRVSHV